MAFWDPLFVAAAGAGTTLFAGALAMGVGAAAVALLAAGASYVQILLGAIVRHKTFSMLIRI